LPIASRVSVTSIPCGGEQSDQLAVLRN
jgi:hypothetical protein